jgi:L-ascorbate metabolism protein UlaG (beta-lactamase superfamily)
VEQNPTVIDSLSRRGLAPIDYALAGRNNEIVAFLLERGVSVHDQNRLGETPLFRAVAANNADGVAMLVEHGAEIDPVNEQGTTPLWSAVAAGHCDMAERLLDVGASPAITRNRDRKNLLHLAALSGSTDLVGLLLDAGCNPEQVDSFGHTPLHYASRYGHSLVFDKMAEFGEDDIAPARPDIAAMLTGPPSSGEARVWYLGHCGYAVQTAGHFLIFDYVPPRSLTDQPSLANGRIVADELKDLSVVVFVSHAHGDHYSKAIFELADSIPDITFIIGWPLDSAAEYHQVTDDQWHRTIGGVAVDAVHFSYEDGVFESAYLVETDGVVIYHAGDHGPLGKVRESYYGNIDWLVGLEKDVDLALVNAAGDDIWEPLAEGAVYAIDKLRPAATIPIHRGGREHEYAEVAARFAEPESKSIVLYPQYPGDLFEFKSDVLTADWGPSAN